MISELKEIPSMFCEFVDFRCVPCDPNSVLGERIVRAYSTFEVNERSLVELQTRDYSTYGFFKDITLARLFYHENLFDSISLESGLVIFGEDLSRREKIEYFSNASIRSAESFILGKDLSSGDYYWVIDKKVYVLPHEAMYEEKLSDSHFIFLAHGVLEFLADLAKKPIPYIESSWRYMEGALNQWYPVEIVNSK